MGVRVGRCRPRRLTYGRAPLLMGPPRRSLTLPSHVISGVGNSPSKAWTRTDLETRTNCLTFATISPTPVSLQTGPTLFSYPDLPLFFLAEHPTPYSVNPLPLFIIHNNNGCLTSLGNKAQGNLLIPSCTESKLPIKLYYHTMNPNQQTT